MSSISLRLNPLALFRDGRGAVVRALGDADHVFHFFGILHFGFPLILGKLVDRAYKSNQFIIAHPPCKKEHFSRIFSQGVKKRLLPSRLLPSRLLPARLRRANLRRYIRLFPPQAAANTTSLKEGGIGSPCRFLVQRRNAYSASVCFLSKQTSLFEGGVSEADGRSSPLRGRYRFAMPPLGSASERLFCMRLFPSKTDLPLRGRWQRS